MWVWRWRVIEENILCRPHLVRQGNDDDTIKDKLYLTGPVSFGFIAFFLSLGYGMKSLIPFWLTNLIKKELKTDVSFLRIFAFSQKSMSSSVLNLFFCGWVLFESTDGVVNRTVGENYGESSANDSLLHPVGPAMRQNPEGWLRDRRRRRRRLRQASCRIQC
jgi:hypothetical protein